MMELSFSSSFFFMLFILPLILHKFVEADNKYEECDKPFPCGSSNINLTYPFYDGGVRPSYCGYPGFQVDCSKTMPEILMSSQTFYLLNMSATSGSITVTLQSYYDDGFCPQNLFLINLSLYNYASTNENITIYYGCPTSTTITTNLNLFYCNNASNKNYQTAYYMIQNSDPSEAQNLNVSCQSSVVVPEQLHFGTLSKSKTSYGFGLEWIAENELCDRCSGSGGKCGSDEPMTKFACYCPNGSFDFDCNGNKSNRKGVIAGVLVGGGLVAVLIAGCLFIMMRRRKRSRAQTTLKDPGPVNHRTDLPSSSEFQSSQEAHDYTTNSSPSTYISQSMLSSYPSSKSDLDSSYHGVKLFSYSELEEATDNFNESRQLGDGGFGVVYYGKLHDGREVAVKRLYEGSVKRMGQFMNEVTIVAHLRHDNLVSLYGRTSKRSKDLIFVYEYIPNGTVADHLHGKLSVPNKLTWSIRLKIAVETAKALSYLHDKDVIHRDVKTTNILLDNSFKVKVADFGLSRLFPQDVTHVSTAPQGTPGYLDPYYYQCFRLTEKSDVYSFGVVLIELISSKMAVDIDRRNQDINLAIMAIDRIQREAINELVDPNLGYDEDYDVQKMVKLTAELAFQCLQHERDMRPSMKEVLKCLEGIQQVMVDAQKQVVVYIQESDDDVGLLRNAPPFSLETGDNNRT